jgi:hypothetical protein
MVRNANKYKLHTLSEINSLFDRVETVPDGRSANANLVNRLTSFWGLSTMGSLIL